MIQSREQLEAQKLPQLKQLIVAMGGQPSPPSENKQSLINRIMYQASLQPKEPDMPLESTEKPVQTETPKQVCCTIQEVISAVNPFILRGMKVYHNAEENGWLFRVKLKNGTIRDTNTGEIRSIERWRDDSGTLSQPLDVIKRCASVLMQGAPGPTEVQKPFNPSDAYQEVA